MKANRNRDTGQCRTIAGIALWKMKANRNSIRQSQVFAYGIALWKMKANRNHKDSRGMKPVGYSTLENESQPQQRAMLTTRRRLV